MKSRKGTLDKGRKRPDGAANATKPQAAAAGQGERLGVLLRVTRSVTAGLDLSATLDQIVQAAAQIAGTQHVKVLLVEREKQVLRLAAELGGPTPPGFQVPMGTSYSGTVATTGEPLFIADTQNDPNNLLRDRDRAIGIRTFLGLPIKGREEVLGVLTFNTEEAHHYTSEEVAYLQSFADQAAIAIENARSYESAQRELAERRQAEAALAERTRHLDAVRMVAAEITRELDLPALLSLITNRAMELVGASQGMTRLWDEVRQGLIPVAGQGAEEWERRKALRLGESVAGAVAQERQGLIANDFRNSPYATSLHLARTTYTAVIAEPLLYRNRLVGVLSLARGAGDPPFTTDQQESLRLFASQAAIAIENAQLFQQEQERRRQLDTVRDVTAEITRELDLRSVLRMINRRSVELLNADSGAVVLWDEGAQVLVPAAWQGHGEWYGALRCRLGEGMVGTVASRREGLLVNDYRNSPHAHPLLLLRTEINATLVEPLLYRERLLGVLSVDRFEAERGFTEQEQRLLNLLASQASIAIENARLFSVEQERRRQVEAVREVTAEITRELDLEALLRLILQRAMQLVQAPGGSIRLWDAAKGLLIPGAWQGVPSGLMDRLLKLGEGVAGMVAQRREGLIVNDYRTSQYTTPLNLELGVYTAMLSEPLLYRDRLVGVITLDNGDTQRPFTEQDRQLLSLFATQAAIAIENARLHTAAVRRGSEMAALLGASQAIESSLDLPQRLQAIVEQAAAISGAPIVRLFLLDEGDQLLRCKVGVGFPLDIEQDMAIPMGASLSGQVAVTGQPMAVADTRVDSRTYYPTHVDKYGVVSYLGLPVKFQDRLFGVLVFNTSTPRTYAQEEIAFLNAFAQQAALAIQNARLYEAAQHELADRTRAEGALKRSEEEARRLSQEDAAIAEIGRIISSRPDIEDVFEQFAEEVRKSLPFDRIVINSINVEKNVVRNLYIAGEGLRDRNTSDFYPLKGSGNAEMVRTQKSFLLQGDDFRAYQDQFPALVSTFQAGFRSILNVPLFAKGQVIGGLLLRSRRLNAYTDRDVRLAERIGVQIAGAVANAQLYLENVGLYEAAQREIAERQRAEEALAVRTRHLEAVRSISEEITRKLDLTAVLDLIVQRAAALVGATSGNIRLWDERQQMLVTEAWIGSERHSATVPLQLGQGVAGAAAEQRRGLIVNDFRKSSYAIPTLLQGSTHSAVMVTPLLYGERLVGTLAITREETEPPFVNADLEVLNLFAPHASIAIENARLYEAAQREIGERRQAEGALALRTNQLEAVRTVTTEIARELDLVRLLELITQRAVNLVGAGDGLIRLWDDAEQLLLPKAMTSSRTQRVVPPLRLGEGVAGTAAQRREGLIVNDFRSSPYAIPLILDGSSHTAVLAEPLLYRDRLVGVITIDRYAHMPAFTEDERSLITLFAGQATIAIENARLHEAAVRWGQQFATLTHLTQSLVASTDAEAVGREVVAAVHALMPQAGARLWDLKADDDPGAMELLASIGLQDKRGGTVRFRKGEGLAGLAADTRKPIASRDLLQDPRFVNKEWAAREKLVSAILFPLLVGDVVHGILAIFARELHDFSDTEVTLFQSLATHAAIAIEKARLYATVQHHARELEVRVKERTAELESALQVKAEFLARMSHELRTPLNFVIGFSQLLKQGTGGPLSNKQAQFVDRIHTGGKLLLDLVSDLLELSQAEIGKHPLQLEIIPLAEQAEEILALFDIQVSQKRLTLSAEVDRTLHLVAERRKLTQILTNLVGNAVKFTPEGGSIRVTARQVQEDEDRGAEAQRSRGEEPPVPPSPSAPLQFLEITVEDTGIGLAPNDLDRIFRGFEQVDSSPTRQHGGAGIGLALVRTLVQMHGGCVWAESDGLGKGARFIVRFPRLAAPSPKRVLVVEDDPTIFKGVAIFLRDAGYAVTGAGTGADAIAALDASVPDLVILDIGLPDMDGWAILKWLRENARTQSLPVLVLTGLDDARADEAKALGASEFLTKPFSPQVLVKLVSDLLTGAGIVLPEKLDLPG